MAHFDDPRSDVNGQEEAGNDRVETASNGTIIKVLNSDGVIRLTDVNEDGGSREARGLGTSLGKCRQV